MLAASVFVGGGLFAQPDAGTNGSMPSLAAGVPARTDISVMTYNVKGVPWPLALGRPAALGLIGGRLAALRQRGMQPDVVLLQEAFIDEAKALGRRAGYRYVVEGAYTRDAPTGPALAGRDWRLGETGPAYVDSGLVLLSDWPVIAVRRSAFPAEACAGYDCLAAKGVLVAELERPDGGRVAVATTHLNCQGASGAPKERTTRAYAEQVDFLARYLADTRASGVPMIVAGDFNMGERPARIALLDQALARLGAAKPTRSAIDARIEADPAGLGRSPDARWIRRRARDLQFAFDGAREHLEPMGVAIPFGTEPDGSMLSDHMGYTVNYRVSRRDPSLALAP